MSSKNIIPTESPSFDTEEWRELRNEKLKIWVEDRSAIAFIIQFSDFCEVLDDLWDGDKEVTKDDLTRILFVAMTEMPINSFFDQYKANLIPVIVTGINAWLDANELERGGDNDKVFSYVLRDWYAELIAFVVYLTRGRAYMRSVSMDVRTFFTHHETLEEYKADLEK